MNWRCSIITDGYFVINGTPTYGAGVCSTHSIYYICIQIKPIQQKRLGYSGEIASLYSPSNLNLNLGEIVLFVLQVQILLLVCRPTHHSSLEILHFNVEIQVCKVYKLFLASKSKGWKPILLLTILYLLKKV